MGFKCGIVGLPNVGKSTLFNALTHSAAAQAENYPFCTIEPNLGDVAVPDPRLFKLADMAGSARIIPTRLIFVDIAGLVRGAAKGEGLGNQFLANIREVDAIAHVLRCFEDEDVSHVEGGIDPLRDAEIVETELMLADLESLERRKTALRKKPRGGPKGSAGEAKYTSELIERALDLLGAGRPARLAVIKEAEQAAWKMLNLLTAKPVLYVCNVEETAGAAGRTRCETVRLKAREEGAGVVVICAEIESELARMEQDERSDYLAEMGFSESGLDRLIREGYRLLDLVTFFTAGPKETRAWTVPRQTLAPRAAGVIHTDFEKTFIRAQTIAFDDYVIHGGENGAREAGKLRLEGKNYSVCDGDVMHFRFAK
ncbi:MAG: redox-regulated ATPase YchF [Hyphomicrobiales bacterium]